MEALRAPLCRQAFLAAHTWSESSTGTPSCRSHSATVDLPMAMPGGEE